MSEIWLLLAIACVFSSVLLVGFALDASSTERKRAVRLLENQVSGSHRVASANLREHELSQSFGDRVLVPFVGERGAARPAHHAARRPRPRRQASSCLPEARKDGTPNGSSRSR